MEDRLQWIRLKPGSWIDWEPVRGGLQAHALVARRYPEASCLVAAEQTQQAQRLLAALAGPWWRRLRTVPVRYGTTNGAQAQMLWANMALHLSADPQALIGRWHEGLAQDGFLMFSCLGPDSLRELRALYRALDWPPPGHDFTDMHDWGDMLVHAGFAEPVMDMERITLTYESAGALLADLRQLGANFHPQRFPALRGRAWRRRLEGEMVRSLSGPDGRLALTFEIIYGHALKPAPRVRVSEQSAISLRDMRALLGTDKPQRR